MLFNRLMILLARRQAAGRYRQPLIPRIDDPVGVMTVNIVQRARIYFFRVKILSAVPEQKKSGSLQPVIIFVTVLIPVVMTAGHGAFSVNGKGIDIGNSPLEIPFHETLTVEILVVHPICQIIAVFT